MVVFEDLGTSTLPPLKANPAPAAAPSQPDPQRMQQVMAELRLLGALDPAAQADLLEQLRQCDASLWPSVVEQFRATAAYQQRAAERTRAVTTAGATGNNLEAPVSAGPAVGHTERLPAVNDAAVPPAEAPQATYASTSDPASAVESPANKLPNKDRVVQASYTAPLAADWRQGLAGTIEALEAEVAKNPAAPAAAAQQARLRMLYAAAGRRDDAMRPLPATSPAGQQFLSKELEGLSTWLNVEQAPEAARRAAEAKPALSEALVTLAEAAPLAVRNVAFCTEIQSYGCTKRFEKYEFQPNQEVLLYAEVENFVSEPTPKGFHTSLRSNYQIVDARGQRVAEHAFATTEETCQNRRRDFFIGYHLSLPKGISPGRYSLRLSIEELRSKKLGQASIEFEVKKKAEVVEKGGKGGSS